MQPPPNSLAQEFSLILSLNLSTISPSSLKHGNLSSSQPHGAPSCRLSIPQKLSKSTLSLPCSHRTTTSTPPSPPFMSRILKPSAGPRSSSSSSITWSLPVELSGLCCCFRLAARDQTFSLAKPTPVAMIGRYCHCNASACSVSFSRFAQVSIEVSIVKEDSEGKGSRCLGSVEVPLATFFRFPLAKA